jgi:hypothetical protein
MSYLSLNYDTEEDRATLEHPKTLIPNIIYCLFIDTLIIELNNQTQECWNYSCRCQTTKLGEAVVLDWVFVLDNGEACSRRRRSLFWTVDPFRSPRLFFIQPVVYIWD